MSQDELQFLIEKILRCVIERHEVKPFLIFEGGAAFSRDVYKMRGQ